jgi:Protein of unknown function (DUF559)
MRGKPEKSRPQLLRTDATEAERKIWYFLRNRQFEKFKFRRQHPIGVYIAYSHILMPSEPAWILSRSIAWPGTRTPIASPGMSREK